MTDPSSPRGLFPVIIKVPTKASPRPTPHTLLPGKNVLGPRSLTGRVGDTTGRDQVGGTHSQWGGAPGPHPILPWGAPRPLPSFHGAGGQSPTRITEAVTCPFTDRAQINRPPGSDIVSGAAPPGPYLHGMPWGLQPGLAGHGAVGPKRPTPPGSSPLAAMKKAAGRPWPSPSPVGEACLFAKAPRGVPRPA